MLKELTVILRTVVPELPENIEITESSSLRKDLGLDSLKLFLFAVAVEDNYDIRFTGNPQIETMNDVVDYIFREKGLVNKS